MQTYLICGLGNPGDNYAKSRHNIGFKAIEEIHKNSAFSEFKEEKKFLSLMAEANINGNKLILSMPLTYMNKSGEAVQKIKSYYKIPNENIIILYDDIDLPLAEIRIRKKGGAGTHNGMKSVIQQLGSEDFPRVRIGIGEPYPAEKDLSTHVLEPFTKTEMNKLSPEIAKTPQIIEDFVKDGIEISMNKWN